MIHRLDILPTIDSTNIEAMRRIRAGERGPLWLLAHEQTAGKGRSGRGWTSEPGNFYGSLILPLTCPLSVAHHLALITGIAVVDALTEQAGAAIAGLRLKWPNDVLVGQAKLAGILLESTTHAGTSELMAVIGIGINLENPPASLGRPVAALNAHVEKISPDALIGPISRALEQWLRVWNNGRDFASIAKAWLARAGEPGESMSVNTGGGAVAGAFVGLDPDGALLLRTESGDISRFTYGDVTLAAGPSASHRPQNS